MSALMVLLFVVGHSALCVVLGASMMRERARRAEQGLREARELIESSDVGAYVRRMYEEGHAAGIQEGREEMARRAIRVGLCSSVVSG